jgi:hypothetical protein
MSSTPSSPPDPSVARSAESAPTEVGSAESTPAAPATAELGPAEPATADLTPAECAARLKSLFPALFVGAPRPLKLRIQADIQQRAPGQFSKRALSAFLHRHTGSTSYLLAVAKTRNRFDLDGAAAGEISDEHRQAAEAELARRRANHEARRALEDEQRHNRATLLRDFDGTTLARANFCALKGVAPDALDELLAMARREADEMRSQRPPAFERERRPQPQDRRRPAGGQRRNA